MGLENRSKWHFSSVSSIQEISSWLSFLDLSWFLWRGFLVLGRGFLWFLSWCVGVLFVVKISWNFLTRGLGLGEAFLSCPGVGARKSRTVSWFLVKHYIVRRFDRFNITKLWRVVKKNQDISLIISSV